jgi:UDP-4-amino-4,6-dideoxy-N-acetyl-beta-L-altrosamine transaminase
MVAARYLPYGRQVIEDDDIAAVAEALRADYLTTGPTVEAFEGAFAEAVGAAHAVVCNSGTAALHLAAMALDLKEGDWLVVPSLTFLATANAARYVGAEVLFADVDPETGLLTGAALAAALDTAKRSGRRVRAVAPVHLTGRTAPLAAIAGLAKSNELSIIEDACHALGTTHDAATGRAARVGDVRYGTLAAFSFHPVKTIAVGEGGMITTNDGDLAARMRVARSHGMIREPQHMRDRAEAFDPDGVPRGWYYEMHSFGYNYRMPDVLCALGISQLKKLGRFTTRRRELARLYDEALKPLAPLVRPVPPVPDCDPALHLYAVLIAFDQLRITRQQLMARLRERGIGTQVHYIPVHRQPYYRDRYGDTALPGADAYYSRELSLPLFPAMTDAEVGRVVEALTAVLEKQ